MSHKPYCRISTRGHIIGDLDFATLAARHCSRYAVSRTPIGAKPQRSSGMDVTRNLLAASETQVNITVAKIVIQPYAHIDYYYIALAEGINAASGRVCYISARCPPREGGYDALLGRVRLGSNF